MTHAQGFYFVKKREVGGGGMAQLLCALAQRSDDGASHTNAVAVS